MGAEGEAGAMLGGVRGNGEKNRDLGGKLGVLGNILELTEVGMLGLE